MEQYTKKLEAVLAVETRKSKALQEEVICHQTLKAQQKKNENALLKEWNYFVLKMENKVNLMKQDEMKLKEHTLGLETILQDQAFDLANKDRQIETLLAKKGEAEDNSRTPDPKGSIDDASL